MNAYGRKTQGDIRYPYGYYCDRGQHDVDSADALQANGRYEDDGCLHGYCLSKECKPVVKEGIFFRCKQCTAYGTLHTDTIVANCPICGSRHVTFYKSEADFNHQTGRN